MLICQLRGRKRVLLFPPAAYGTLLPYPSNHPLDRRATLDVGSCDVDDVTARELGGVEVVLQPGEALYVPPYVWHEVSTLHGEAAGAHGEADGAVISADDSCERSDNISLSVRLHTPPGEDWRRIVRREPCAAWMAVSRNVEQAMTGRGGAAEARGGALLLVELACAIAAAAQSERKRRRWRDARMAWDGSGVHCAAYVVEHLLPTLLRFLGDATALVEFLRRLPLIGVAVR